MDPGQFGPGLWDVHLAGVCGYPLAAAIPIFTVSACHGLHGVCVCVAFIDGARGKKGRGSPERNYFGAVTALKGLLSGPRGVS